jgi:1-deoxy-D-xylulose-5-phosphate reductoisomerase
MKAKKRVIVLGATGSVGRQALDVIAQFPDKFEVIALTAGKNIALLKEQIKQFKPQAIAIGEVKDEADVRGFLKENKLEKMQVFVGKKGLEEVVQEDCDLVVVAIVGIASLKATYKALDKGINVALASKEVLVVAGEIITQLAEKRQVQILPLDSEHAAIKQCLAGVDGKEMIKNLYLTASGGPFWQRERAQFKKITVNEALKHPKWQMGAKITIDSATLMNKGLEVIEAYHLFKIDYDCIKVVVHPQSIVHSMVEFIDGNIIAQMGLPDMRFPIQYALSYPDKWLNKKESLSVIDMPDMQFLKPDFKKFPLLKLAYEVGKSKGNAAIVMNAANDIAVQWFLQQKISFCEMESMVKEAVNKYANNQVLALEEIELLDDQVKKEIGGHY